VLVADKDELTLKVIRELEAIAFSDIKDYMDYDNDSCRIKPVSDVDSRAVQSVQITQDEVKGSKGEEPYITKKIQVKLHDKVRALEGLSKYLGMFKETINATITPESNLNVSLDVLKNFSKEEILNIAERLLNK
jgi:phage terminase small subunit